MRTRIGFILIPKSVLQDTICKTSNWCASKAKARLQKGNAGGNGNLISVIDTQVMT